MKLLHRNLIAASLFIQTLLSSQSTNFLKTFTTTAAYSSTASYGLYNWSLQGVSKFNNVSFILGGSYSRFPKSGLDTLIDDAYLIKNQYNGLTKWFRKYYLPKKRTLFYDIEVKYNQDIIAVGTSNAINYTTAAGIILTTDSNGYLKSVKLYRNQPIFKVTLLSNKKIVVLSSDTTGKYLKLVLLDKNADPIWSKNLSHSDTNCCSYRGFELIEGANKSILVLGYKFINHTSTGYTWYPFAMLCDSNGTKINDMVLPIGNSQFLNASNQFDHGFYIVGSGGNLNNVNNLYGHLLKVNNQLQIDWYNLYQCNYTHVEFTDVISYSRNNISILTEPEASNSNPRRAGYTFIDTLGNIRKSFLFNPLNTDQYPDKMMPLQNGKVLFTLYSNAGRLFGVNDTIPSGFCNMDTLTWTKSKITIIPQYNNLILTNSNFGYIKDTAYVYTPKDAELLYVCSNGPTAPLDTVNYPPPPTNLTGLKNTFDDEYFKERFVIQPNPTTDYLYITTNLPSRSPIEIRIYNSEGKLLTDKKISNYIFPLNVDLIDFSTGLYFISIRTFDNQLYKYKFVVDHN